MAKIAIQYKPRRAFDPLHDRTEREAVVVAHRRAGKTVACINELIKGAVTCTRHEPRFAYVAPYYAQAKDVAWSYLKQFARGVPGVTFHESELRCDLPNGGRIRLYGAENADRLRGVYLDGVVMDEVADMDPRVWPEVVAPTLIDRQGWAVFIGTPKGMNAFAKMYEAAVTDPTQLALLLRASETGLLPADELERIQKRMTAEQYDQEFECSFTAAIRGAYYGKEMSAALSEGRILPLAYEHELGVETWWDIGVGDSTAIWFVQRAGQWLNVIDYYEASGENIAHYAKAIHAKPYTYSRHIAPHDIANRDWSQPSEHIQTRQEVAIGLGIRFEVVPRVKAIDDRINAVRLTLPRCRFDPVKCARGIEALQQYRTAWNDKMQVFADHPLHNWASNGADAFGTGIMAPAAVTEAWQQPITYKTRVVA